MLGEALVESVQVDSSARMEWGRGPWVRGRGLVGRGGVRTVLLEKNICSGFSSLFPMRIKMVESVKSHSHQL